MEFLTILIIHLVTMTRRHSQFKYILSWHRGCLHTGHLGPDVYSHFHVHAHDLVLGLVLLCAKTCSNAEGSLVVDVSCVVG